MKYIFYFIMVITLASCTQAPYDIKYTATGTVGTLNVSYIDGNGNNQSYTGSSPWHYSFSVKKGTSLKVSANCDITGTSEVHIFVNGIDKVHDTETGLTASASTNAE